MKKTGTKKFWKIVMLFFAIGLFFGYSTATFFKSKEKSDSILQTLKDASECAEVNQLIYAKGIQFGPHGMTTEKGQYQLKGCEFISVKEEANRLNTILKEKVKGFDKVDFIELEFVNKDMNETIYIKNGKIQ